MTDEEPEKSEFEEYRTRASSSDGGRGTPRRRTRVGSGGDDDESVFNEIMRVLRKFERETGRVPTLVLLSLKTGLTVTRIHDVLSNRLSEATVDGDTEFESSLKALLFGYAKVRFSREEWMCVQAERERTGEPISLILARLGMADEKQVKNALELQYGVSYVSLSKIAPPDPDCLALLPDATIRQFRVVPIEKKGDRLTIAMVNPNNLVALENVKRLLKGMQIKLSVCMEEDFNAFMETTYASRFKDKLDPNDQDG